jgi:hypothetical protein
MQAAIEPTLDESHFPVNGSLGGPHQCRRLFGGATEEAAQFHETHLICVNGIQFIQRPIEFEEFLAGDIYPGEVIAQRNVNTSTTANLGLVPASMIDQNPAHHLCGEGIEMSSVFIGDFLLIQEFQLELMHQSRCLEQIGVPLPANVGGGDLAKMGIDKRH